MNSLKITLLVMSFLLYACDNRKTTGYSEIDQNYTFKQKERIERDDVVLNRYLFDSKSDSVYSIITDSKGVVSRGWTYNFRRIGDWYFEHNQQIDSIYNYINYCGGIHHVNTIKYIVNDKSQFTKGYWHEFIYDKTDIKQNKAFNFEIKINYDKELYKENLMLFLFHDEVYNADYCDFKKFTKDSMPSFGDDFYNVRITPKDRGTNNIQGYYLLMPKKQLEKDIIGLKPVFFREDFEVK
ncbi:hypothetical protein [Myroides odoratus]|uniref:hypothetical protein n=1 Tax=Myroides odoratus TaxID=256 RepID=UPI0039AEC252